MKRFTRKTTMLAGIAMLSVTLTGCELVTGFGSVLYAFSVFWKTTPLIPVDPLWSQKIEDEYWETERYDRVPVLDPVEGEFAPTVCMDPPSPDQVYRALPDRGMGGMAFVAETSLNNVRIVVEPIVDRLDECKFFPLVGPARLHHCHYKCTVYFEKVIRSDWPVPFRHADQSVEVVYIDKDHLIRCAGPVVGP
ncbi:MAG: hypothetical protein WD066_11430 [Planctomycetaceae bacterium]